MSDENDLTCEQSAFPIVCFNTCGMPNVLAHGMTLRDWFAGQALCGLMSDPTIERLQPEGYAKASYDYADAMIEVRKR